MNQDRADFVQRFNVSRETFERLEVFEDCLLRWNKKINLIASRTIPHLWSRHIADSAQVLKIAPEKFGHWVDLGSGGGFPGVVVAIMSNEFIGRKFTLVESDQRKATFLRAVARECGVDLNVISARIESLPHLDADVVSARALAPLDLLLSYAKRHLRPHGFAIFLKGKGSDHEIDAALDQWQFRCEKYTSVTDPDGVLLKIGDIQRV